MLILIAILSIIAALALLIILSLIDLKYGILPNTLVFGFFVCGIIFHLCTGFIYLTLIEMLFGALAGGGILYGLRAGANRIYKQDTLGLGDVKLMGAGGLWLGPSFIMSALFFGAMLGVIHGLGVMAHIWFTTKKTKDLGTLSIPAGPAFAAGLVIAGALQFQSFPDLFDLPFISDEAFKW